MGAANRVHVARAILDKLSLQSQLADVDDLRGMVEQENRKEQLRMSLKRLSAELKSKEVELEQLDEKLLVEMKTLGLALPLERYLQMIK